MAALFFWRSSPDDVGWKDALEDIGWALKCVVKMAPSLTSWLMGFGKR